MLPRGIIWQQLRQRALAVIPAGCYVPLARSPTLKNWIEQGAFTVTSTSSRSFEILASPQEVGSALFAEAAFFLDHASEHSVTTRHQLSSSKWNSAAWLVVTFYYWSFFLILSITRMLGKTGWFLTKDETDKLRRLANTAGPAPGAGPYALECGAPSTMSQIVVTLKKAAGSRVHDLAWRLMFDEIRALVTIKQSYGTGQLEERLFGAILQSVNVLGPFWPSELRNIVNYSPGVGYAAARRTSRIEVFGAIAIDPPCTFETALDRLENNVAALLPSKDLLEDLGTATKILVDMTFALESLAQGLHTEIVERHSFDLRWLNARNKFLRQQFHTYGVPSWPYRIQAVA
jgi:hypothetical protein